MVSALGSVPVPARRDPPQSNPARIYDYLIGGKDNLAVDRAAAQEIAAAFPSARRMARANRGFLVRALWFLAAHGVRQYIDLGTGFPTSPNVHEVAQQVFPDARAVYIDNDPVVTAHNRALRATMPGVVAIHRDIRRPGEILADPDLLSVIDFAEPVAVLMVAVLHFISPEDDPAGIIEAFRNRMAPDSYLVLSHGVSDDTSARAVAKITAAYEASTAPVTPRTAAEVEAFFDGFDLAEPGVVDVTRWRPERHVRSQGMRVAAGVGRKGGT
ncbi:MAG: SAM-dependent methyltransferase [Actinomycetota bacterium]|nr:SAM-dependent methyltransferase [Actinomycetota bacterium]